MLEDITFTSTKMNNSDNIIESIISEYWDILGDKIPFSHYSSLPDNERSVFYDSLRKYYPIKYEFGSSLIDINQFNESVILIDKTMNDLRKLGFKFKKK